MSRFTMIFILLACIAIFLLNMPTTPLKPSPTPVPVPIPTIKWVTFMPVREVSETGVIGDARSHVTDNTYDDPDPITTVHESTHGANSLLRNRFGKPAFYVLNNKAVLIDEPTTTLADVANIVPPSLRGDVYDLYLIRAQRDWNNQPSYVFDEATAYCNGTVARQQLGIQERSETVRYSTEFCVYSTCVVWASGSKDNQTREFLRWSIERALRFSWRPEYLDTLKNSSDAEGLRKFMRHYYGSTWTKKVFGW